MEMIKNRRALLLGLGASLICAPAIVRASSLMAIKPMAPPTYSYLVFEDLDLQKIYEAGPPAISLLLAEGEIIGIKSVWPKHIIYRGSWARPQLDAQQ